MLLPLFHYQFVQLLKIPHKQIHTVKPPTNGQLSTTATSLQRQPVLPDGPYIDSCLKTFLQRWQWPPFLYIDLFLNCPQAGRCGEVQAEHK